MNCISELFIKYTTESFCEKLEQLVCVYSGLTLGKSDEQRNLLDELEFNLEIYVLKRKRTHRRPVSEASFKASVEKALLCFMEKCDFSHVLVKADQKYWDPKKESYRSFTIENIEATEIGIFVQEEETISVKHVFEAIQ